MNTGIRLVKVLVQPHYVVEDEEGRITGEVSPQQALSVYAHEVSKLHSLLDEIQEKVAADVLAPKS